MAKVLVFGASNSSTSINQKFAIYSAQQIPSAAVTIINLNDFEMPIFSVDREQAEGVPEAAHRFKNHLRECDGIIISFAEHNGSYSTAFKNIFDWSSRIEKSMWLDKPMLLLATSPGGRGAQKVLAAATGHFPFMGANVVGSFSLPSFNVNFNLDSGITDVELKTAWQGQLDLFIEALD